jgi:hypothetical protein
MQKQVAIIKKNYGRTAHVFQLLAVVVLVAAAYYGYLRFQQLSAVRTSLNDGQTQMVQLQTAADGSTASFGDMKKLADDETVGMVGKIQNVFPADQNYTGLTKMLDYFFTTNDKPDNRIFENSISYSAPIVDAKNEYAVLPFTMSILTSRENFEKFLRYVDSSGDLEGSIRLMDIKSFSLALPAETAETAEGQMVKAPDELSISLSMNTYYQKPAGNSEAAAQ